MLDLLKNLKFLLHYDEVRIDSSVFRLHYTATAILLGVSCLIVTSKQYIGDPITCILDTTLDMVAINTYCWIFSTFTVIHDQPTIARLSGVVASPYPGIRPVSSSSEVLHHSYYQWICFLLALQAGLFVVPHCLWRVWEGGRIKVLTQDLCSPVLDTWPLEKKDKLIQYLTNKNTHNGNLYALQYLFCELLNVANVVLAVFMWNKVLCDKFLTYGPDKVRDAGTNHDLDNLFPKITKCEFRFYGASGSVQHIDSLCLLPLNTLNEKIFIALWFWFCGLFILSCLSVLYDVALLVESSFRVYVLQAQVRFVPRATVIAVVRRMQVGDWFVVHQLGRNLSPIILGDLITELAADGKQTAHV